MSQVWHHFVCTLTMHLDVIHLRCYSMPWCSLLPHVTSLIQSQMHQIAKYICMIKKWRHRLLFSLKVHQLWSINDIQDRKFLHISSTTQTHSNTLLPFCLFLLQLVSKKHTGGMLFSGENKEVATSFHSSLSCRSELPNPPEVADFFSLSFLSCFLPTTEEEQPRGVVKSYPRHHCRWWKPPVGPPFFSTEQPLSHHPLVCVTCSK